MESEASQREGLGSRWMFCGLKFEQVWVVSYEDRIEARL